MVILWKITYKSSVHSLASSDTRADESAGGRSGRKNLLLIFYALPPGGHAKQELIVILADEFACIPQQEAVSLLKKMAPFQASLAATLWE